MTMIETDILALCECCTFAVVNGDESGCRDYFGHTHKSVDVPAHTVPTGDWAYAQDAWTCDGCGEGQATYSTRHWFSVLEVKHTHGYDAERADWWCFDCSTVTDYCEQTAPR